MSLWTQKYAPKTLDEYVFRDIAQREQIEEWIKNGRLPNVLLSGSPGTGKSTLCELLLKILKVPKGDIIIINASRERNLDMVENKIMNFISTWPIGDCKYVILAEADNMHPNAQKAMREVTEQYDNVRFLFNCNYPERIIPALHSRCQGFHIKSLNKDDYVVRLGEILTLENIEFDPELLFKFANSNYPDMRKAINSLQQNTRNGKLHEPMQEEVNSLDYVMSMIDLFKAGKYTEARKLIVAQAQPEEYVEIFRFLYRNLELFGKTEDKQNEALLIIRKGLVNHSMIADAELNLAATIVELQMLNQ